MKSVLFISPTGTLDNGAEISIVNFMENLIKKGYVVLNIAPQAYHPNQIEYYDYCTLLGIKTLFIPVLKWWWEDAPGGLPGTIVSRSESYKENIRYIRKIIRDYDVDVVITNTVNMFQGAVASSCENVKHLWLIHEFPENEFKYYNDKTPFISDFSDAIFAVQGNLQNCLEREFYPKEIFSFIPYTKNINKNLNDGKVTRFISIGMITKGKNQLELLKAYRKLNEPQVELIFIGSYEENYYKNCLEYVKVNSLKNVSFTGYMEDPWSIVSNKDICIFTSSMETFGLVYVESILNAVPTILSDNPGHMSAYNILEKGEVYQLGNIEELVSKMNCYLSNFQTIKNDCLYSKESVNKKYNIDTSYLNIEKEIKNSIEKPHTLSYIQNIICNEKPEGKGQSMYRKISNIATKVKLKFLN